MTDEEIVALLQHPIPYVQKQLTERDKSTPVTIDEMKEILSAEKAGKERVTLTGWLEYGIATKRLPDQFFLSYQDRVSCFKSALQKYVRRGLPEKAMSVAKSLYKLNRQQAVRRMKIIVVEDVFQAVEVLKFFRDDMSLNEFLALVKVVAESPKDKSLCTFGEYVTDGAGKAQIEQLQPDPMFVRENLMNKELFKRVVAHLFKMSKLKRFGEINSILGSDPVVKQCVDRVEGGTFWESDSVLLLMAAVRFLQGDYKTKIPSLPQVDEKDVPAMKLAQIDWYCLDFHTCVGRAV
ncbi:MAG: hypothetical protein HY351_02540, partial [Candidatus Omnitrophica bacterium]|nr:hypothetical protein [Candidatus Omnitrophota bacterium]